MGQHLIGKSPFVFGLKLGRLEEVICGLFPVPQSEGSDSTIGLHSVLLPMIEVFTVVFFESL